MAKQRLFENLHVALLGFPKNYKFVFYFYCKE